MICIIIITLTFSLIYIRDVWLEQTRASIRNAADDSDNNKIDPT